jgi:hypothetical protein
VDRDRHEQPLELPHGADPPAVRVAIALGRVYPRWTGWMAAASGVAFMYNGVVEVAYAGFGPSIVKLVGILLWLCGRLSWPS